MTICNIDCDRCHGHEKYAIVDFSVQKSNSEAAFLISVSLEKMFE